MYVFACMYVFVYLCMYICMYVCMYIWMNVCNICVFVCMYVCMKRFTFTYLCQAGATVLILQASLIWA